MRKFTDEEINKICKVVVDQNLDKTYQMRYGKFFKMNLKRYPSNQQKLKFFNAIQK